MARRAEIISQGDYGPEIEVYDDETGEVVSAAEHPGEWLTAVREAELFDGSGDRNFAGFMFQNGRRLDDLYGPRIEADRA